MSEKSSLVKSFFFSRKHFLKFLVCFSLANSCFFFILGVKYLQQIFSSETLFETTMFAYTSLFDKFVLTFIILVSYIGHFALLAFLPCLLLLPFLFIMPRLLLLSIAACIWTITAIILLADNILFSLFHFHLNFSILELFFSQEYPLVEFLELSSKEVVLMVGMTCLILLLEMLLAIVIWKKIIMQNKWRSYKKFTAGLASCLLISWYAYIATVSRNNNVFALQTPTLPFYNNILATILPGKDSFVIVSRFSETRFAQHLYPVAPLKYPLQALQCYPKKTKQNIIFIVIDTLRYDALNKQLTPTLQDFSNQAWQFTNHYSGGNSTQAGLFSLFYGLPVNYWQSMREQKRSAIFIDELTRQGYQTKILFSSAMTPPFHKTIFYGLPNLRITPAAGKTIPDHDRAITHEFQTFLESRNKQQPFFAFLFYDAVHGYFREQNIAKLYPDSDKYFQRLLVLNNENQLRAVIKRYKNAVHFVDGEIKKVLAILKKQDLLKNSIIIITSDHGEEFGDNKQLFFGHGSNYGKYQIHVPFVVWWPDKKPQIFTHQTSHYDVAATLLSDVLGCINGIEDYSIGKNLLAPKTIPYLLTGSYTNMGIVEKDRIITLFTSGNIQVTDDNMNILPNAHLDKSILHQALADMRRYYR